MHLDLPTHTLNLIYHTYLAPSLLSVTVLVLVSKLVHVSQDNNINNVQVQERLRVRYKSILQTSWPSESIMM